MSVEKLRQDILYCQKTVRNLILKHYDQDRYMAIIDTIFKDIFKNYLNTCPDKLEPQTEHIPEKGLKIIRKSQGQKSNK